MTSGIEWETYPLIGNPAAARLLSDDNWASGHGACLSTSYLGAGILYYSLAYMTRAEVCVCLGSGGGFVPRLMRQAQRDLGLRGSRTIVVDGADKVLGENQIWGTPDWTDSESQFRASFPEIEAVCELTTTAFSEFFKPEGLQISYLHIDAGHHYENVRGDWELFGSLVRPDGLVTIHDTLNFRPPCGVPRLIEEIRADPHYELVNLPIGYGTALVRRRNI